MLEAFAQKSVDLVMSEITSQSIQEKKAAAKNKVAAALCACLAIGLLFACFIAVCGARAADGPAGSSPEGLLMTIFPLFVLWETYCFWGELRAGNYKHSTTAFGENIYWVLGIGVVLQIAAAIVGYKLDTVRWGHAFVHVQFATFACAIFAVCSLVLILVHRRMVQLSKDYLLPREW
jgi:FtsH-binding integral membrane protein